MNIHEILEVVQWVIFTSLGYYLFDKHLTGNLRDLEHRCELEVNRHQEQVDRLDDRNTELVDRVHAAECQIIHAVHRLDELDPPD